MRYLFICFTCLVCSLSGQKSVVDIDALAKTGRKILEAHAYVDRKAANEKFLLALKQLLADEETFETDLTKVNNALTLTNEAGDVKVITWQMPDSTFSYVRFGLVAVKTRRGVVVTELKDKLKELPEIDFRRFTAEEWPGALYYKMIPIKSKGADQYTLLGYAPSEELNRKIIDVLEVKSNGMIRFGAKVFQVETFEDKLFRKAPYRLILKYNSEYSASVQWKEKEERIVMDHLSPSDIKLKGVYQMYGPDFTYDALYWEDGWWKLDEKTRINS